MDQGIRVHTRKYAAPMAELEASTNQRISTGNRVLSVSIHEFLGERLGKAFNRGTRIDKHESIASGRGVSTGRRTA